MRVLYVSAWFPWPPDNGARLRTYYLLKALAVRHEVHLISMLQEDSDPEQAGDLADICRVVSTHRSRWFRSGTVKSGLGYFSRAPRSFVDTYSPTIRQAVEEAVAEIRPDVIVASTLGAAPYIPTRAGIPTFLDEHNSEYAVLKRAAGGRRSLVGRFLAELGWRKFARWEAEMCGRFSGVSVVSRQDMELLMNVAPGLVEVSVAPNGVDSRLIGLTQRRPKPGYLIYQGALTYGANLDAVRWFASDVHPLIARDYPDARLRVTGRAEGVELGDLRDSAAVELVGYVDDIREALAEASVCVVPLRQGGGSRLKVLEAMAAGVPVASTSVGVEGLDVVPGKHVMVGNTAAELSEAVRSILADPQVARELSDNARELVVSEYDWSSIGRIFVAAVEKCAGCSTAADCRSGPGTLRE